MLKDLLTQSDNQTYCAIRLLGFVGVVMVGAAAVIGSAPLEVGMGVAAVITAIGGSIRLKGQD